MGDTKHVTLNVLTLLMLVLPIFGLELTIGSPATIAVPDDFATIQEAINSAVDGDTIFVKPGIYYEHVVVNRTVALIGEDASTTIIDGNSTGHVVHVVRDNVSISGFTVQRSGNILSPAFDSGICLNGTAGCNISEIRAVDNGFCGVSLRDSQRNTITHNNLTGVGYFGIWLQNSSTNMVYGNLIDSKYGGITSHHSSFYNNITENVISDSDYGMFYHAGPSYNSICRNNISAIAIEGIQLQEQANYNTVAENSVRNCSAGIKLIGPNCNNTLSGNFVTATEYGIKVENQANSSIVEGNTITGARFGVVVNRSRYADICNNTIAHNHGGGWGTGVYLDSAGYTLIRDNEITDNWRAIHIITSSPNVTIYGNNVTYNEFGIRVFGGGSSYLSVLGNYVANNRGGYGIGVTGIGGESNYAVISGNAIVNNIDGVALGQGSNRNTVFQNNISKNDYGIGMEDSTQNLIYNNNIMNNIQQASITSGSVNAWNGSYALGGNYWSDYVGSDCRNGPNQNLAGCDGFGDTPRIIDGNNRDNYPIMKPIPWDSYDIGVTCLGKVGVQGASSMKTVIAEGTTVHFGVFVMNYGNDTETFNVTTSVNATPLGTQTGITISSRGYAIVNFTWNTSSFERGSYLISAEITTVSGETDIGDNSLNCPVTLGIIGDVDNNGIVNMLDVYNIALHYGAVVGQANYVSNYDIDDNDIVNMLDLYNAAVHYGQTASAGMCVNTSVLMRRFD